MVGPMGRSSPCDRRRAGRARRDMEGRLARRRERRVGAAPARHESARCWDGAGSVGCGMEVGQPESQPPREPCTAVCAPAPARLGLDIHHFPEARRCRGCNRHHPLRAHKSVQPLAANGRALTMARPSARQPTSPSSFAADPPVTVLTYFTLNLSARPALRPPIPVSIRRRYSPAARLASGSAR
jgi:hypothetical protein